MSRIFLVGNVLMSSGSKRAFLANRLNARFMLKRKHMVQPVRYDWLHKLCLFLISAGHWAINILFLTVTALSKWLRTIPGTLQFYAFIPDNDDRSQLKKFSASTDNDFFPTQKQKKSNKWPSVKGRRTVKKLLTCSRNRFNHSHAYKRINFGKYI